MASTILVTAADGRYHESVVDLVRSVRATGFGCDIGIILGDRRLLRGKIKENTFQKWSCGKI